MTVKLAVKIEPLGETAKVKLEVLRETEKDPITSQEVVTSVPAESPFIEVEEGDKVVMTVEPGSKILYDKDQFTVRVETDEEKKGRKEEKKAKEAKAKEGAPRDTTEQHPNPKGSSKK